ncbi:MAG: hypothetical protein ABSF91_00970 [Bacteroidota bacterium]
MFLKQESTRRLKNGNVESLPAGQPLAGRRFVTGRFEFRAIFGDVRLRTSQIDGWQVGLYDASLALSNNLLLVYL